MKYTRKDYNDNKCTHREYYAQFVSEETKKIVLRYIGLDRLKASKDQHLNDIALGSWDTLPQEYNRAALSGTG